MRVISGRIVYSHKMPSNKKNNPWEGSLTEGDVLGGIGEVGRTEHTKGNKK